MSSQYSITRLRTANQVNRVTFGQYSTEEKRELSAVEITNKSLFNGEQPVENGLHDPRMGSLEPDVYCGTCHQYPDQCTGHRGHYECPAAIYSKNTISVAAQVLQSVCISCGRPLVHAFRSHTFPTWTRNTQEQGNNNDNNNNNNNSSMRLETLFRHGESPDEQVEGSQDRLRSVALLGNKRRSCIYDANVHCLRNQILEAESNGDESVVTRVFTHAFGEVVRFPMDFVRSIWPDSLQRQESYALQKQFLRYVVWKRRLNRNQWHDARTQLFQRYYELQMCVYLSSWRRMLQPRYRKRAYTRRIYVASLYDAHQYQQLADDQVAIPTYEIETKTRTASFHACRATQPVVKVSGLYLLCKYPLHAFRPLYGTVGHSIRSCVWRGCPWSADDTLQLFRALHEGTERCVGFWNVDMVRPEYLCLENILVMSRKHRPYIRTAMGKGRTEDSITTVYASIIAYGQELRKLYDYVEHESKVFPVSSEQKRREWHVPRFDRHRMTDWWLLRYPPPTPPVFVNNCDSFSPSSYVHAIQVYQDDSARYVNAFLQNVAFMNLFLLPLDGLDFPLSTSTYAAAKASEEGPLPKIDVRDVDVPANDFSSGTVSLRIKPLKKKYTPTQFVYPQDIRRDPPVHSVRSSHNAATTAQTQKDITHPVSAHRVSVSSQVLRKLDKLAYTGVDETIASIHPMDVWRELWAKWEHLELAYWTLLSWNVQKKKEIAQTRAMKEREEQNRRTSSTPQLLENHLGGKYGRLRGTLASKRSDFTVRTVITPTSEYDVFILPIPEHVACVETVSVSVNRYNRKELQDNIRRGAGVYNGAANIFVPITDDPEFLGGVYNNNNNNKDSDNNTVDEDMLACEHSEVVVRQSLTSKDRWNQYKQSVAQTEYRLYRLKGMDQEMRNFVADNIRVGWTVEVHLGSRAIPPVHLINRAPILSKENIIGFIIIVQIVTHTKQINTLANTPFNADFDGDEMNMNILQTLAAVAEAWGLCLIPHMPSSQEDGKPLYGPMQDTISGAYVLTYRGRLFTREQARSIVETVHYPPKTSPWGVVNGQDVYPRERRDTVMEQRTLQEGPSVVYLGEPAILKGPGVPAHGLYTGHQIMSTLFPADMYYMDPGHAKQQEQKQGGDSNEQSVSLSEWDNCVHVYQGDLVTGQLTKATVGMKRESILQTMAMEYGHWALSCFVSDFQRLVLRYTRTFGTVNTTLTSCTPPPQIRPILKKLLERVFALFKEIGELQSVPAVVRESRQMQLLQSSLNVVRSILPQYLPHDHPLNILVQSGAKGSNINIAQIMGLLGQQSLSSGKIEGHHMPNGDIRTLPVSSRNVYTDAVALGFCLHSYYHGLDQSEYFNHAKTGREGLVDGAVSTSKAGTLARSMMQPCSTVSVQNDGTIRNVHMRPILWTYLDGFEMSALRVTNWTARKALGPHATTAQLVQTSVLPSFAGTTEYESRQLQASLAHMLAVIQYRLLTMHTHTASMPYGDIQDDVLRTPVVWRPCMERAHFRAKQRVHCDGYSSNTSPNEVVQWILADDAWQRSTETQTQPPSYTGVAANQYTCIHTLYMLLFTDWVLSFCIWLRTTQANTDCVLNPDKTYDPCYALGHLQRREWTVQRLCNAIHKKANNIAEYWKHGLHANWITDSTTAVRTYCLQWAMLHAYSLWRHWFPVPINEASHTDIQAYWLCHAYMLHDIARRWMFRVLEARVAPGEAVGTQAVHSAMRPASQSTLNVFHLPGVAQQQSVVATGLDRIDQLVRASDCRSTTVTYITPSTTSHQAVDDQSPVFELQARLQGTSLGDLIQRVDIEHTFPEADIMSILHPRLQQELDGSMDNVDPGFHWKRTDTRRQRPRPMSRGVSLSHTPETIAGRKRPRPSTTDEEASYSSSCEALPSPMETPTPTPTPTPIPRSSSHSTGWTLSMYNTHDQRRILESTVPRQVTQQQQTCDGRNSPQCPVGAHVLQSPWLRYQLQTSVNSPMAGMITPMQEWFGCPPSLRVHGMCMQNVNMLRNYIYKHWEMLHMQKKSIIPSLIHRTAASHQQRGDICHRSPPESYQYGHVMHTHVLTTPMCLRLKKQLDQQPTQQQPSASASASASPSPSQQQQQQQQQQSFGNASQYFLQLHDQLWGQQSYIDTTELPAQCVQGGSHQGDTSFWAFLRDAYASRRLSPWHIRLTCDKEKLVRRGLTISMLEELLQCLFDMEDVLVLSGVSDTQELVVYLFFVVPTQMVPRWISHEMPIPNTFNPVDMDFLCIQQFATQLLHHRWPYPLHGCFKLMRSQNNGTTQQWLSSSSPSVETVSGSTSMQLRQKTYTLLSGFGADKGILGTLFSIVGIDAYKTWIDNPVETQRVLGIDAASTVLERELQKVFLGAAPTIDPRHARVIARTMTSEGFVTAMTRKWLYHMVPSVITNISYERTVPGLFEASCFASFDSLIGNQVCMFFARRVRQGTGRVQVNECPYPSLHEDGEEQKDKTVEAADIQRTSIDAGGRHHDNTLEGTAATVEEETASTDKATRVLQRIHTDGYVLRELEKHCSVQTRSDTGTNISLYRPVSSSTTEAGDVGVSKMDRNAGLIHDIALVLWRATQATETSSVPYITGLAWGQYGLRANGGGHVPSAGYIVGDIRHDVSPHSPHAQVPTNYTVPFTESLPLDQQPSGSMLDVIRDTLREHPNTSSHGTRRAYYTRQWSLIPSLSSHPVLVQYTQLGGGGHDNDDDDDDDMGDDISEETQWVKGDTLWTLDTSRVYISQCANACDRWEKGIESLCLYGWTRVPTDAWESMETEGKQVSTPLTDVHECVCERWKAEDGSILVDVEYNRISHAIHTIRCHIVNCKDFIQVRGGGYCVKAAKRFLEVVYSLFFTEHDTWQSATVQRQLHCSV